MAKASLTKSTHNNIQEDLDELFKEDEPNAEIENDVSDFVQYVFTLQSMPKVHQHLAITYAHI